jgi:hypothetical protein
MFDSLRPFLSRIVATVLGGAFGWLTTKTGIEVDPATQASIAGAVVVGVYGVAHKLIDKKVNPADSASKHLAVDGKVAAEVSKAAVEPGGI